MTALLRNRIAPVIALGGVFLLSACSGAPEASTATVTVTATATATAEPEGETSAEPAAESTADAEAQAGEVGEAVDHAGARLTVNSAEDSDTLSRNDSNYRQGSGYESYTEVPADDGGRFIVLEATVENIGKESMDLTCSWPINIKVVDMDGREFDTVDNLYELKNNPECNAQLQPGFSDEITYAFMVPEESEIIGVYFQDTNSLNANVGAVRFTPTI